MAVEKNIQIKQSNGTDWDSLFPKTKAAITLMGNGSTVESVISDVLSKLESKATTKQVQDEINKLVGSAPDALDTIYELSEALGADPNFATTITEKMAKKVDKVSGKGLSTNDFTAALKTKLDGLKDYSDDISKLKTNKADKSTTYTKSEVDAKVGGEIPVSSSEPGNEFKLWFQEL